MPPCGQLEGAFQLVMDRQNGGETEELGGRHFVPFVPLCNFSQVAFCLIPQFVNHSSPMSASFPPLCLSLAYSASLKRQGQYKIVQGGVGNGPFLE